MARTSSTEKKSQRTLWYLIGLTFAMVGASYAAVPLYKRFCQATGYGGTVQRREKFFFILIKCSPKLWFITRD
ncbi:hypothetical protein Syun_019194 [Stephania yunnanensis]|uniref:Uncharacterized protein n=1 Tax=Stephania yunnanensis TaxID=152371 RepID=A0AAP0IVM3_9MAGN